MKYAFLIAVLGVLGVAVAIATLTNFRLSNEAYDRLKTLVLKWSGIVTFLGVLVSTFKFEFGEETITIVAAIGALLAYLLGVSNKNYVDGAEVYERDGGIDESDYL